MTCWYVPNLYFNQHFLVNIALENLEVQSSIFEIEKQKCYSSDYVTYHMIISQ